ncbi:MAG: GNAT family N-acetyltransferase [Caldimonas sp.]
MSARPIEFLRDDCQGLEDFLAERIYEFNSAATGYFDADSFAAAQKDESGSIVGGVCGYTWGGCCIVSYLWVAEDSRGRGLGSALLLAAEQHARDKGCMVALVSSHSFQAPGFYKHMGYEERASIEDYPLGHSDVFYAKRLTPESA